jgi:hypothetical protein
VSGSGDATVRLWDTFSWEQRQRARDELRAARPQAERLVKKLFEEGNDADQVMARIRADTTLSEPVQRAAWHAVLRHGTERQP